MSYLGCELDHAKRALENEGYTVSVREIRSKKGIHGNSKRVIRQRLTDEKSVELCFSCVLTNANKEQHE